MLAEAVTDGGTLKKQNTAMNFTIWLVGILVVYNIFYNRLFEKKRDFIALRKIGFQTKDLMKIAGMEFLIFILIGFAIGILAGYFLNQAVYGEIMKAFAHAYDAEGLVSSELSWDSVGNTTVMLLLMAIPSMAGILFQLQNAMPTEFMPSKRKNTRKQVLALLIVSLSAILISILGTQDNHSDEGILFVKEYVPGDLQVTAGSIYENIQGGDIPSISDSVFQEMKAIPGIRQVVNVWIGEVIAASNLEHISDTNGYSFRNANSQIQKYVDSDHSQKVIQCFFIIILAVIGLLVYFNTIFTNLLNRRNDFKIMHKIGIRKKEMCWMVTKEGLCQGGIAAGVAMIVQIVLSVNRQEPFFKMFVVTDVIVAACVLFPVFLKRQMLWVLIGVYGSVITRDEYEKSDLDLMILINDENGQVLADGFIIDDVDIGYDLYCTSWDMLEKDEQYDHAHLSKLFDSVIVYCKDKSALKRLGEIRRKAAELLASNKRYEKADQAYSNVKKMLAEVYLAQSLSKARSCTEVAIEFIENAVMLYNGQYFRKGTKRALDEFIVFTVDVL